MKFLRLLFLASSLACLASFSAQASDGLSLKKEDLHIKKEQPNLPATKNYEYLEQIKKLKKSQDYAKKTYNPTLELNALEKLALISGRSSKEYLIAYVRFKVNQGGKAREEAKEAVDKLCKMGKYTYECIQGKALYDISSPQMKIKLQSFNMHETNRDYEATIVSVDGAIASPTAFLSRYRSDAGNNFVNFRSEEFDQHYAAATEAIDEAVREQEFKACEKVLTENAASVYLQDIANILVYDKKFDGYAGYPLYAVDFSAIYQVQ